jgi:CRP-like cAMP-binding protein
VGYGDIAGTTFAERMVAIVVMFMGVSMYSYIGGSISSLVSNGNSISSLFKKQSNMLRQSLDAIKKNVDPALTNRIVQQCEYVWRIRTETDGKYLSQLPTDIRNETILYIHRTHTPCIAIVSDTPKLAKWIAAPIVQIMTPELVHKGQKLEMWSGHILYFVTAGAFQLEIVDEEEIFEKKPIYFFRGDTFGFEFSPKVPRSRPPPDVVCNKSMRVVALEDTQVFGLSRHDVATLIRRFPSAASILKTRIHEAIQKTSERQYLAGEPDWRDVVAEWAPEPEEFRRRKKVVRKQEAPPIPPVPENPLATLPPLRTSVRPQSAASSIETREYFPFVIEDL